MSPGIYERLTSSAAGMAVKEQLRRRAPVTAAKFQRAIRAARRSLLEPVSPPLSGAQLLWSPPPRRPRGRRVIAGEVTSGLFARLTDDDLAVMRSRMTREDSDLWQQAGESERRLFGLHFCVHYGVPGVLEKTGLTDAKPPADVSASSRGSLAAGGSFYYADLVADSLSAVGVALSTRQRVLDFGCSSGRVVRVLAPTHPSVEWHACDPDRPAINWAAANLPGAQFFTSAVEPPLPFPDDHFDFVYAFSIWTHYSEPAALRWLDEMRRIIAVGGHLLLTASGFGSVGVHAGEWGNWPAELVADVATGLYADGHKFVGGYGKELSLATATRDWGEAFFTSEWLADHACPSWAILDYEPGHVENHQDLYVLERRA